MNDARSRPNRRAALGFLSFGALLADLPYGSAATAVLPRPDNAVNEDLARLRQQLAAAPRRRAFRTGPFMITARDHWDHEAAAAVLAYRNRSLQVWECTFEAAGRAGEQPVVAGGRCGPGEEGAAGDHVAVAGEGLRVAGRIGE